MDEKNKERYKKYTHLVSVLNENDYMQERLVKFYAALFASAAQSPDRLLYFTHDEVPFILQAEICFPEVIEHLYNNVDIDSLQDVIKSGDYEDGVSLFQELQEIGSFYKENGVDLYTSDQGIPVYLLALIDGMYELSRYQETKEAGKVALYCPTFFADNVDLEEVYKNTDKSIAKDAAKLVEKFDPKFYNSCGLKNKESEM